MPPLGSVTLEATGVGVRLMQPTMKGPDRVLNCVTITPAQLAAVKAWFALVGGPVAPTNPETIS